MPATRVSQRCSSLKYSGILFSDNWQIVTKAAFIFSGNQSQNPPRNNKMSVNIYQFLWRTIPEDVNLQLSGSLYYVNFELSTCQLNDNQAWYKKDFSNGLMKIEQLGTITKLIFIHFSAVYQNVDNWSITKHEECLFEMVYVVYRSCTVTDCQHVLIATRDPSHVSILIIVDRN